MHKISIVTITYNSARYLDDALQSIADQSYPDIESIVVDGGSTDGTQDIIRKHERTVSTWVSEPDEGIADAMNKGIGLATGEFVYFLHSDDYLNSPTAIEKVAQSLSGSSDIYLFDIFLEAAGQKDRHRPRGLNTWINFKTGVYHQSAICRRSLFERIGRFDTRYRIAMDYEFFLRAYRQGVPVSRVNQVFSTMRLVGVSSQSDWESLSERFSEEKTIHRQHCRGLAMSLAYRAYWALYLPYRRLRNTLNFSDIGRKINRNSTG